MYRQYSTVRLSTVTMRGRSCFTPLNNKAACSLSDVISWIPTADNDLCNHYHFQTEKTSNTQGQTLTHVCPVWTVVMSWLFLLGSHHSGRQRKYEISYMSFGLSHFCGLFVHLFLVFFFFFFLVSTRKTGKSIYGHKWANETQRHTPTHCGFIVR